MNLRYTIIFLILFIPAKMFAQPGRLGPGRGGLVIERLFNSKLEEIQLPADTALKIRTFVLHKGGGINETFVYQEKLYMYQGLQKQFGLEAIQKMSRNDKDIHIDYPGTDTIYRMYIIYKADTMIVDFADIISPPAWREYMDSLVIQNGYFRCNKHITEIDEPFGFYEQQRRNSLTPFTTKQLVRTGDITYDSTIDLSFLDEQNLNALYFERQARQYLKFNQGELALASIFKAIEKNNGNKTCTTSQLLFIVYLHERQYEHALETISAAMYCSPYDSWDEYISESKTIDERNYTLRISLFIQLKKYDKALIDYDSLCAIYKDAEYSYKGSRGFLKLDYLKDYKGAIADFKEFIDESPDYRFCYYDHDESFRYSNIYFNLAKAEYLTGDKQSAFRHWLIAAERGYRQSVASSYWAIYYDSIIHQNPAIPELYLVRGIEYMKVGKSLNRDKKVSNESFVHALQDIHSAEELGMDDYRINLYRAVVLYEQQNYDAAMKEIDLAIAKDNTVPQCFDIRYKIRLALKQAVWDRDDVDMVQVRKLAEDWTWEKW